MSLIVFTQIKYLRYWFLTLFIIFFTASLQATQVNIEGIDNSDIEKNVRLFIKQVKLPMSELAVDDYQIKLRKNIKKALHAYSYYDAKIIIQPITYATPENLVINVNVQINSPAIITRVVMQSDLVEGNDEYKNIPNDLLNVIKQVQELEGKVLDQAKYDELKNRMTIFSVLYGYFDFKFILHKLSIIPEEKQPYNESTPTQTSTSQNINRKSTAIIHWIFVLNKRYRFGELDFLQETRGQNLASNVRPFKTGEFFDQSKIGEFSLNMASTGYFDNAIARANAEKAENLTVPIEVILQPKPKDLYQFGVGFSTDTRARFSIDWKRPWVNLDGHELGAKLYLSDPRKSLSLDYRIPKANPLNDFLNYRVTVKQTTENQTQSDNVGFEILRQWGAENKQEWDKIGFVSLERESFIQGIQDEQTVTLLMPGVTFNRTRKNGDIFVNWGDRQQLTVQAASKSVVSDIDLFKILLRTKWIREFGKHRWTWRADAGAIATNDFDRVPSSQRFFAGGDQSVRGFGHNELSEFVIIEQDGKPDDIELLGGKYLAVASVEYAFQIAEKWRIATFIDAGNATNEFASDIATGVGVGAHWLSPIGNVQVYVARGNSKFDKNSWRLHLIIGPGL